MFTMLMNSIKLFLRGRLFRDSGAVFRAWLIGFVIAVTSIFMLAVYVNVWLGATVGGLIGGALMPYLFRDLKYN